MVHHFFGSKADLFLAALEVPVDPRVLLREAVSGPPDQLGAAVAGAIVGVWEDPSRREPLLALLRAAMSSDVVAGMVRDGFVRIATSALAPAVSGPDARLRIELAISQVIGMELFRYVIGVQPLASTPAEELVARLGPVLQQHLRG